MLHASQLERRMDNDVKNHWNTKLKKSLAAAAAAFSTHPLLRLLSFSSLPAPTQAPALAHPLSPLLPLAAPIVKAETYTYDGDFLAPIAAFQDPFVEAEGSTSASLSAVSPGSYSSAVDNSAADGGFFADFCTAAGSDLAATDQFLSDFYYPLDPTLSLV